MSPGKLHRVIEENPTLELKIVSASNMSNIYTTDKIDAYAVVSIKGDASQKKQAAKTPIDYDGDTHPTWNHTVKFSVNEERVLEGLSTVYIRLYSYWLEGENDLFLGEVNVSVQELLIASDPFARNNGNKMKSATYPIKFAGETKPNAKLTLSYRFKPVPVDDLYPQEPVYTNPEPVARSGHQTIMYSPQFQTTQAATETKLTIEIMIKSARDIKNVNVFDDMDVYASVMICQDKTNVKKKTKTPVAYSGFKFPIWNHAVKFTFDQEDSARDDSLSLVLELMSHRPVLGDKHIGKVDVLIQDLMAWNAPSPLNDVDVNTMKLVTRNVKGCYGEQGTLSFTYRFLEEKVTVPNTTPQPFIMYVPVPYPSYGPSNPVHGTSGDMAVPSGANVGPSNGMLPIYMPHPYQPHEYQQPQLLPQKSQPQQHLSQLVVHDTHLHSQLNVPHGYHQYSPSPHQQKPQPPPPNRPTQPQVQTQGARPQVKPQGGSNSTMAAVGLGAAVLGRVIGGALMSDLTMSDEFNMFEVEA